MSMTCIVSNGIFFEDLFEVPLAMRSRSSFDLGRAEDYRAVRHQPGGMPEFIYSKPLASLNEAKSNAETAWAKGDVYWDKPDDDEQAAIKGIICVMRSDAIDLTLSDLHSRIVAAGGDPGTKMAAIGLDGLVAWIETKAGVDTVFIANNGKVHLERCLAQLDPFGYGYEGCQARYVRWYGSRLVVVTRKRAALTSGRFEFLWKFQR